MIFAGMLVDVVREIAHVEGSLAKSHHPLLYVASAGAALLSVYGSWLALQLVDRVAARLGRRSPA
jgi:hypothetical protein